MTALFPQAGQPSHQLSPVLVHLTYTTTLQIDPYIQLPMPSLYHTNFTVQVDPVSLFYQMFCFYQNPSVWWCGVFRISLVEPAKVEPTVFQLQVNLAGLE